MSSEPQSEYEEASSFGFTLRSGIGIAALGVVLAPISLFGFGIVFLRGVVPLPTAPVFILVLVGTLVVHELVHGLGFLLVGAPPRFSAGIRGGLPYLFTNSPGHLIARGRMMLVGVLPLVGLDLLAIGLGAYASTAVAGLIVFALNTTGAAGDLWLLGWIARSGPEMVFEAAEGPRMVRWRRIVRPADGEFARSL